MANENTAALLASNRDFRAGKAKTDYEAALEEMRRKYGIAGQNLNANYEQRGILRSGEANTGRVRLGEQKSAEEQNLGTNYEYNTNMITNDYLTQLAALQAATPSSGGTSTTSPALTAPAAPAAPARTTPAVVAAAPGQATTPGSATSVSSNATYANTLPPGIDFGALARMTAAAAKPAAARPRNVVTSSRASRNY